MTVTSSGDDPEPMSHKLGNDHKKPPPKRGGGLSDRSAAWIIGVVTVVWAGNILVGMLQLNDYKPAESVNGIFMAIVGGAFIARARRGEDD